MTGHTDYGSTECWRWRRSIVNRHPALAGQMLGAFCRVAARDGNAAGNQCMAAWDAELKIARTFSAGLDDDGIRSLARVAAARCEALILDGHVRRGMDQAVKRGLRYVERMGLDWPAEYRKSDTDEERRERDLGALARLQDARWWRRQLRSKAMQAAETFLRREGYAQRRAAPYVSDFTFRRWASAQRRNAGLLENMIAESDAGDVMTLADCAAASVSNPANRHAELMVRMRGWEEVATAAGLVGAFFTLTCPGRFHARHWRSGELNDNFSGATPREGAEYLGAVWARIRSDWARRKIKACGFRVAEPHHDGTPHFHFLLFLAPQDMDEAWRVFQAHALADDPREPGALKHRADMKRIDASKGTAAGYIAKYVAKNVTGAGLDGIDEEGEIGAVEGSQRVRAWASCWGIRQFQQIGSVSVTVWRELRRRRIPFELDALDAEQVERARLAADAGEWAEFVELMGGVFAGRADQLLRACHVAAAEPGRYGEQVLKIVGLVVAGMSRVLRTRDKNWRVYPAMMRGDWAERGPPGRV